MKNSYFITEGKVKTSLEKDAEDLSWVIRKGYDDETIMFYVKNVEAEIKNLKKNEKLKEVV